MEKVDINVLTKEYLLKVSRLLVFMVVNEQPLLSFEKYCIEYEKKFEEIKVLEAKLKNNGYFFDFNKMAFVLK